KDDVTHPLTFIVENPPPRLQLPSHASCCPRPASGGPRTQPPAHSPTAPAIAEKLLPTKAQGSLPSSLLLFESADSLLSGTSLSSLDPTYAFANLAGFLECLCCRRPRVALDGPGAAAFSGGADCLCRRLPRVVLDGPDAVAFGGAAARAPAPARQVPFSFGGAAAFPSASPADSEVGGATPVAAGDPAGEGGVVKGVSGLPAATQASCSFAHLFLAALECCFCTSQKAGMPNLPHSLHVPDVLLLLAGATIPSVRLREALLPPRSYEDSPLAPASLPFALARFFPVRRPPSPAAGALPFPPSRSPSPPSSPTDL
ncbi:unnamed protein product, partial [Ectocarpus sp. 12 AP-2014]